MKTLMPLYGYALGRENRYLTSVTFSPVSSITSRAMPLSADSMQSQNPPGRSSVPLAGSLALLHTSTLPIPSSMMATVDVAEFMKYSKPQSLHFLLLLLFVSKPSDPHTGQ